jgi:hypothetical protein
MIQCINNGELDITLRGIDFRNINNIRSKIYINYTKLSINNKDVLKNHQLIWHDTPYTYNKICNNEEIVYLKLNFETIFTYFPELEIYIKKSITKNQLDLLYKKVYNYITVQKLLITELNPYLQVNLS